MAGLSMLESREMPPNFNEFYFAFIKIAVDNYFQNKETEQTNLCTYLVLKDIPLEKYGYDYFFAKEIYVPNIEDVTSCDSVAHIKFLINNDDSTPKGRRPFVYSLPESIYAAEKTVYISKYHVCVSMLGSKNATSSGYLLLMPAFLEMLNRDEPTASFPVVFAEMPKAHMERMWSAINNKTGFCSWPVDYKPPPVSPFPYNREAKVIASLKASHVKVNRLKRKAENEDKLVDKENEKESDSSAKEVCIPIIDTKDNEIDMERLIDTLSAMIKNHEDPDGSVHKSFEYNVKFVILTQKSLEHFAYLNEDKIKYLSVVNREEACRQLEIPWPIKNPSHHIIELNAPMRAFQIIKQGIYSPNHICIQTSGQSSKEGFGSMLISPVFVQNDIHHLNINVPVVLLFVKEKVIKKFNIKRHSSYACFKREIPKSAPPPENFKQRNYNHKQPEHAHIATSRTLPTTSNLLKDYPPPPQPQPLQMPKIEAVVKPKITRKRKNTGNTSEHAKRDKLSQDPTERAEAFVDEFTRDTPSTIIQDDHYHHAPSVASSILNSKKLEYFVTMELNGLKPETAEVAEVLTHMGDSPSKSNCVVASEPSLSTEEEVTEALDSYAKSQLTSTVPYKDEYNFTFLGPFDVLIHGNLELVNLAMEQRLHYHNADLLGSVLTTLNYHHIIPKDLVNMDPQFLLLMGVPGGLALEMIKIMNESTTRV